MGNRLKDLKSERLSGSCGVSVLGSVLGIQLGLLHGAGTKPIPVGVRQPASCAHHQPQDQLLGTPTHTEPCGVPTGLWQAALVPEGPPRLPTPIPATCPPHQHLLGHSFPGTHIVSPIPKSTAQVPPSLGLR